MEDDDLFTLQEILVVMYHPPSEVLTFWQLFFSRENEPLQPLHHDDTFFPKHQLLLVIAR